MSKVQVRVPQADGEIVVSVGGREPTTYKVTDHQVTVEEPDVDRLLSQIDGSKIVGGTTAAAAKKEQP